MNPEQSTISLKPDAGRFIGIASRTNQLDRSGDLILQGAFLPAISGFLDHGFVAFSHLWDVLPLGFPLAASDGPEGLKVLAAFHPQEAAQSLRQLMKERLERKLSVGLSVGFRLEPSGAKAFANGREMVRFLTKDYPALAVNHQILQAYKQPCRAILSVAELFEISIAMVPVNNNSLVTFIE